VGLAGNKGAAGAKVYVYEAGTKNLLFYEEIENFTKQAQQNYYGLDKTERHYGLGTRAKVDVAVHFYPSFKRVELANVAANTTVEIGEDGSGMVVEPEHPDDEGNGDGDEPQPDPAPEDSGSGCSVVHAGGLLPIIAALVAGRRRRRRR
jgi:MYXO-CTERM domain-containing protein